MSSASTHRQSTLEYSEGSEMSTDCIVHDKADTVGVVVIEYGRMWPE